MMVIMGGEGFVLESRATMVMGCMVPYVDVTDSLRRWSSVPPQKAMVMMMVNVGVKGRKQGQGEERRL